jgi:cellulose synthase operon protein YhjQ
MQPLDKTDEPTSGERSADVAILYSWAKLEGGKPPDFSANRREYRAQMRHRAAEQLRLMELRAQSEAEAAAIKAEAEAAAAHAEADAATVKLAASRSMQASGFMRAVNGPESLETDEQVEQMRRSSLREAAQQARRAAAERLEAARRAEAAALADSIARREEREIAEAQASALRQAAQYAEFEARSYQKKETQPDGPVPGRISDTNGAAREQFGRPSAGIAEPAASLFRQMREHIEPNGSAEPPQFRRPGSSSTVPQRTSEVLGSALERFRRARGYQPEEPSGPRSAATDESLIGSGLSQSRGAESKDRWSQRDANTTTERQTLPPALPILQNGFTESPARGSSDGPARRVFEASQESARRPAAQVQESQPWAGNGKVSANGASATPAQVPLVSVPQPETPVDASGPAWLYPQVPASRFVDPLLDSSNHRRAELTARSLNGGSGQTQSQPVNNAASSQARVGSVEETLQHSQDPVIPRWHALKSVFARDDRDQKNALEAGQEKRRNTPFVVVYSLAGGVGKTSLVATLGRALSSFGEKVLLTDVTSQGLLPFYFGASELHPGVVRTFSPPVGSTDAPIHLLSYDLAGRGKDRATNESEAHDEIFEELLSNSHRSNRVLMDANANCGWIVERIAWMKPTILVPLSADMNSVLSLRAVERSFCGMLDADGHALQPVYLLNQFDASLPLHLDVREALKRKLGDRLLPFAIRRAVGVSEALAEGMTIIDYDPKSEVARDYMGVANWLRSTSASATVGLRSLRWNER